MKKFNKEQISQLKIVWQAVKRTQDDYWSHVDEIEKLAKKKLGIDIEIFHCDGDLAGIGDYGREYELVQRERLEPADEG